MSSKPGPLCPERNPVNIHDGTLCSAQSAPPGLLGERGMGYPGVRNLAFGPVVAPGNATYDRPLMTSIEGISLSLGSEMTWDSVVRDIYIRGAEAIKQQGQEFVRTGKMTPEQAKVWTNGQRNAIMQAARDRSSPLGRAIAEAIKPKGKTVAELEALGKSAQGIIESAGKTNPFVNRVAVGFRYAGPALIVVGITFSAYDIATAPPGQRWRVVAGEAGTWAGALAGGWGGGEMGAEIGAGIGTFVEPVGGTAVGGVIGAFIGGIGGAMTGGWIGSKAGNYVYQAIEDTTPAHGH